MKLVPEKNLTVSGVDYVVITLKEYNQLLQYVLELQRLDNAGVDNWEYNYMRYRDENGDMEDWDI